MKMAENYRKNPRLILSLILVITVCIDFIIFICHCCNEDASYAVCDILTLIIDIVLFSFLFKGHSSLSIVFMINKIFECYLIATNKIPLVIDNNPNDKFIIYFILCFIVLIFIFLLFMYFSGAFKILNDYHNSLKECKKYLKYRYYEKFFTHKDPNYNCSKLTFKNYDGLYFNVYINNNLITDNYLEQLLANVFETKLSNNYKSQDCCSIFDITSKGGSALFQEYKDLEEITYQMYADKMQYNCKDINLNYIVDADSKNYVQDGVSQVINLLLFLVNNNYSFTNITITDLVDYIFHGHEDMVPSIKQTKEIINIVPSISYSKAKEMTETGEYDYLYSMFNNYYKTYIVPQKNKNTGDTF